MMVHGITYADEAYNEETKGKMSVRLWNPVMKNGIIAFIRPEDCEIVRPIKKMTMKEFVNGVNFQSVENEEIN